MGAIGDMKFASLSSGLLARKGHARPAMRPQGFTAPVEPEPVELEDLGWNDMGDGQRPAALTVVAPPPPPTPNGGEEPLVGSATTPMPIVEAEIAPVLVPTAAPAETAAPRRAPEPRTGKAAFTLRLDPDRHLRLRLASAIAGHSAQQLVTAALDTFLESQPQIEELARQLPEPAAKLGGTSQ